MKYGYTVKKDGVLYKPGMEVPGTKERRAATERERLIKAIGKMKKEELEAEAVKRNIQFEEEDEVPAMREKLIASLPSEEDWPK